ncbi:FAD:protein FMN transferase [Agromyces sp. NPDC049794]|uniref:FAD:protein FMN transferase n=1 Tax=unclassified Agromyces TaxID=2639701 RepID=UPI0033E6BFD8
MGVHIFDAMGTTVSVRVVEGADVSSARLEDALAGVRHAFVAFERTFSLYRHDSELTRIARGEVRLADASPEVRDMYAAAVGWRARTGGAFTPHRPDGIVDLSGLVKAEAIAAAGDVLRQAGFDAFTVNAGGDVLTAGAPERGFWTTGVVDPADRSQLLTTVRSDDDLPAVATSGTSERGEHIWSTPVHAEASLRDTIAQATVLAGDIVTADVLATAIVAGGRATLDAVTDEHPVGVLAAFGDGTLAANARCRERVVR